MVNILFIEPKFIKTVPLEQQENLTKTSYPLFYWRLLRMINNAEKRIDQTDQRLVRLAHLELKRLIAIGIKEAQKTKCTLEDVEVRCLQIMDETNWLFYFKSSKNDISFRRLLSWFERRQPDYQLIVRHLKQFSTEVSISFVRKNKVKNLTHVH